MRSVSARRLFQVVFLAVGLLSVAGCLPQPQNATFRVRVVADGKESVYSVAERVSVNEFLQQTNIRLDPLDKVNPSDFTPISDNMVITIVRVRDAQECKDETLPYTTKYLETLDLPPGKT